MINLLGRFGPAVTRSAGKRTTSVQFIRLGSPFCPECVVDGHCLVTLSHTVNETLKWRSSLSIYLNAGVTLVVTVYVRYILPPHPHTPTPRPPGISILASTFTKAITQHSSVQSKVVPVARKRPYALHRLSQTFPQNVAKTGR